MRSAQSGTRCRRPLEATRIRDAAIDGAGFQIVLGFTGTGETRCLSGRPQCRNRKLETFQASG
jgi:hypothetical protein